MATTSQTYSLIPTSTLTPGCSTPTDDPNCGSGYSMSDLLSSSGSPPLIVAFLTIGLFVLSMVGVFGWRRISQSRGVVYQPITTNRRPNSISPGTRPILWDVWVWADPSVGKEPPVEAARWENIAVRRVVQSRGWATALILDSHGGDKPVTAILTFLIPLAEPCPSIGPVDPGGRVPFRMLRCLVSAVKRLYVLDPPPPPPPAEPDEKVVVLPASHTSDEIEWGDVSSLQVSVIIGMPTQGRCRSRTSEKDAYPERMELVEFCIGTMDVPWSEGG